MNLEAKLTAFRKESKNLPVNDRAELACRMAKQLEKLGEYEDAVEALEEFWPLRTALPKCEELDDLRTALVFQRAGSLDGWLGSADQIEGKQERAKDLITQSIDLFEKLEQAKLAAEARGDLALCYWREGAFDEARIQLRQALELAGDEIDLKATLLIRAGMVEVDRRQLHEALRLYSEATPFIDQSTDHAIKGSFHNEYGILFRQLAAPENREDYLDRALIEYAASSFHYDQAGNFRAVARVEANLGFLYSTIFRYQDAHYHLDRARRLFLDMKDVGTVAQVDETRARTLLAEGRILEADRMVRAAVKILERGDQQAVLAEALTTHGVILARLGIYPRAKTVLERAVEIAQTTGDLEGAGRAKLSIIEELSENTHPTDLVATYRSAIELLKNSQDPSTGKRLITCADKVLTVLERAENDSPQSPLPSWEGFSFKKFVHESEREVLERALRDAGGSVTRAARLLGFKHHQSLISLINARHKELFKSRSAPRKRRRHLFSEPRVMKKKSFDFRPKPRPSQISILHVEDNQPVADLVHDTLFEEGMHVESLPDGTTALDALKGDTRYDVIILDNDLPGLSGLELILRVRSLPHRRQTPIIMLSGDDCEREAWRAGVNAFLRKPKGVDKVRSTIARLLKQRKAKRSQDRAVKPFVS